MKKYTVYIKNDLGTIVLIFNSEGVLNTLEFNCRDLDRKQQISTVRNLPATEDDFLRRAERAAQVGHPINYKFETI